MQYSVAAVIALAASTAAAGYTNGTVVYTTEVHTAYTTVCPASTELTFNGVTYTATAVSTFESRGDLEGKGAIERLNAPRTSSSIHIARTIILTSNRRAPP